MQETSTNADKRTVIDRSRASRRLRSATSFELGRTMIGIGDLVRVRAVAGKRGFDAKVRAIKVDSTTGEVAEVEVFGGRPGHAMVRTFPPDRIQRPTRSRARREGSG